MPVHTGKDNKGCFAQYGGSGAKYYYACDNNQAMNKAKRKAHLQGAAIMANGGETTESNKKTKGKLIMHLIKNKELKEEFGVDQVFKESSIDEENLTINNVCLFGRRESANGRTYQDKAIDSISNLSNGCKVYLNHITTSEMKERHGVRDIRDWAGVLEGGFRKGEAVFAKNLKVRKEYWELVKDIAVMKPQGIGHSIDARVKVYQDNNGKECVADVETLRSVDLVSSAATTNNLFEAAIKENKTIDPIFELFTEGYIKYRITEKFDDFISVEGVIQDYMDNDKLKYEINDVTYVANDLIRKALYEDDLSIEDKKKRIMSIFDDLDSEIKKRLTKIKESKEDCELNLNDILANKEMMESLTAHFQKQEKYKTLESDLLKVTNDLKEANEKLSSFTNQLTEKDKDLETHKATVVTMEAKCKELEKELDKIKVAEAVAVKKAMIDSLIAEAKLPVEVVTDIFKEDLMGLADKKDGDKIITAKEQIVARIEERKTLAGTKKLVFNSGEGRKEDKKESKTLTKDEREAAALELAKKLKK